jgi:O-antigen/teichoic acid export membrane protein
MLARAVIFNLAGKAGMLIVGFAASVILARSIGPANLGLLGIMVSTSELTLAVGGVGLAVSALYYASQDHSLQRKVFGNTLLYAAGLAGALLIVAPLFREPIADLIAHGRGGAAWILVAAFAPILLIDTVLQSLLLARLRFGFYNAFLVVARCVYLGGVLLLVTWAGLGVSGGLLALIAGSLAMIACALFVLRSDIRPSPAAGLFREMLRYGVRVQVGALFQIVFFRFDVVILQFFVSLADVGRYVVAASIAELVVQLGLAFQNGVFPLTSQGDGTEGGRAVTTAAAVRHHGILSAAATAANTFCGPLVILLVFGSAFHGALVPMLILLPGMWFVGTGLVVAGDLRGRGRPGLASMLGGGTVALVIGLDLALIPPFGIDGASLASLLAYAAFGIASLCVLSRVTGIPLKTLVVPGRADFRLYRHAVAAALALFRGVAHARGAS